MSLDQFTAPTNAPKFNHATPDMKISTLLQKVSYAETRRAAERLIAGGGVSVNGQVVTDVNATIGELPANIKVGARKSIDVTGAFVKDVEVTAARAA